MMTTKYWPLVLLALSGQAASCNYCGAVEQLAVNASAIDPLTFNVAGRTTRLQVQGRITDREIDRAQFRALFDPLDGESASTPAIMFSLGERDPATGELFSLTLAVPATLQRGARYTVGEAFTVPVGLSTDPGAFGGRALRVPGQAEVAFSTSLYSFPPPTNTLTFLATRASGTIEVTARRSESVELLLSLQLTDENGRTATIAGSVQANAERHGPSCIS
jgi:hypothetical protein